MNDLEEIWQAEEMRQAGHRALAFAQTELLLGSRSCIRPRGLICGLKQHMKQHMKECKVLHAANVHGANAHHGAAVEAACNSSTLTCGCMFVCMQ